jgi:hypothetical protein
MTIQKAFRAYEAAKQVLADANKAADDAFHGFPPEELTEYDYAIIAAQKAMDAASDDYQAAVLARRSI